MLRTMGVTRMCSALDKIRNTVVCDFGITQIIVCYNAPGNKLFFLMH